MFRMYASDSTFDSNLKSYSQITPAEKLYDYPKVTVVGLLTQYNEGAGMVMLSDWGNKDGNHPSISVRH